MMNLMQCHTSIITFPDRSGVHAALIAFTCCSGGLWGEMEGAQRRQRRSRPRGAAAAQDQDLRELEVSLQT